jgi:hypothetical protein
MSTTKKFELLILFLYFFAISFIGYYLKLNFLVLVFVFAGIPSVYFSLKNKRFIKRELIECLLMAIPTASIVDYLGHVGHAWKIYGVLGVTILNTFTLDIIIWNFIYLLLIIVIYDYFFDKNQKNNWRRLYQFVVASYLLLGFLFFVYLFNKNLLVIPHIYLIIDLVFVGVISYGFIRMPRIIKKVTLEGLFLVLPSLFFEIVALKLGHWVFINSSSLFNIIALGVTFPIEEALWYILAPMIVLVTHELFVDNRK